MRRKLGLLLRVASYDLVYSRSREPLALLNLFNLDIFGLTITDYLYISDREGCSLPVGLKTPVFGISNLVITVVTSSPRLRVKYKQFIGSKGTEISVLVLYPYIYYRVNTLISLIYYFTYLRIGIPYRLP
ncbi:hypothetical protein B0T11DRAFT_303062 [Plectosphaerella cucumerina]|uniref:Uncharacterized protein n=1 Tax=Plectosphaerella cucumerina TaxID=40658 RepID=A0A8K0TB50_9PEZI|nr:hypothetical protein B0T11DRAFT_303062 [Plectosphaerella cucumerina]